MMDDFKVGMQKNLVDQLKDAMQKNEVFLIKAAIDANRRMIESGKAYNLNQLTKKVMENDIEVKELKHRSNPYVLSETVRVFTDKVQNIESRLMDLEKKVDYFESNKFLDTSITSEELKGLYASSGLSHVQASKFLSVEPARFYQIMNGQEKNPDYLRRSKLKQYFLKKINASS